MSLNSPRYTFKKEERLSRKKIIDNLFKSGRSFYINPFRVVYLKGVTDGPFPAQILITVSRKSYQSIPERNLIRRKIREAYRYSKGEFYEALNSAQMSCAFILMYSGHKSLSTAEIRQKINQCLKRLMRELNEHYSS
jgi:ribonuclease P protein component